MRLAKILLFLTLLSVSIASFAHVGSPGVIYQGKAGPYTVMVNINPPDVIPGTASTSIYIENQQVYHIYIQPIYWYAGDKGSPKADEAVPVKGTPGQYQGLIWLMQRGVASMRITVDGPMGKGSAIIPVMAVSTAQRTMPVSMDWGLALLGVLLFLLMVTIIGSGVTDAVSAPGASSKSLTTKKYTAMAVTALILIAILYGGSAWWDALTVNYRRYLYKPPLVHTTILMNGKQMVLRVNIDSAWLKKNDESMSYVVPDHGKLMHLFLIRYKTLDAFAHLHPVRKDSVNFLVSLPDLPAGRYLLFGDVVRWNGFTETISDTVNIPSKPVGQAVSINFPWLTIDPDDTYVLTNAVNNNYLPVKQALVCGKPSTATKLADGSTVVWQRSPGAPLEANKIYPLTFLVKDPAGKPAKLQPYMGMMGHAVALKYDGSVYVHLHPVGTYSMASQEIMQNRVNGDSKVPALPNAKFFVDSVDRLIGKIKSMSEDDRNAYLNGNMKGMSMPGMNDKPADGLVAFPYAFPSPGNYRIWVQLKRNGVILNCAFDAVVE